MTVREKARQAAREAIERDTDRNPAEWWTVADAVTVAVLQEAAGCIRRHSEWSNSEDAVAKAHSQGYHDSAVYLDALLAECAAPAVPETATCKPDLQVAAPVTPEPPLKETAECGCGYRRVAQQLRAEIDTLRGAREEMRTALQGVIRVADRDTVEFAAARAALASEARPETAQTTDTPAEPPKLLPWEQDFGQPSQAARDADAAENYRKGWQAGCASVAPAEPQTPEPGLIVMVMAALESDATAQQREAAWDALRDRWFPVTPAAPVSSDAHMCANCGYDWHPADVCCEYCGGESHYPKTVSSDARPALTPVAWSKERGFYWSPDGAYYRRADVDALLSGGAPHGR